MIERSLRAVVVALDEAEVRYLVVGGIAVMAHGCVPRSENLELLIDGAADFEAMYGGMEWFELEAGVKVPVCGYSDLVRMKRRSGRAGDLVDLEQLEKVRRVRPVFDGWYECTFEGSEMWQMWQFADLTFGEKLRWLEGVREVGRMFSEARRECPEIQARI